MHKIEECMNRSEDTRSFWEYCCVLFWYLLLYLNNKKHKTAFFHTMNDGLYFFGDIYVKTREKNTLISKWTFKSWKIKFWLKFFFWPIWEVKNGKNDFLLFSKKWNCIKKIEKECIVVAFQILKIWHSKKMLCYFELC